MAHADTDTQLASDLSQSAVAHRVDTLDDTATAAIAAKMAQSIDQSYVENVSDDAPYNADYLNYTSAGFDVDHWDGIRVDGDSAFALVQGSDHYNTLSGFVRHDMTVQYQITLTKSADGVNGWVISAKKSVAIGD